MEGRHSVCVVYLSVVLYLCLYCRTTSAQTDRIGYGCMKIGTKVYISCPSGHVIKISGSQVGRSKDSCTSSCCQDNPSCKVDVPLDSDLFRDQMDACNNNGECRVDMIQLACGVPLQLTDFQIISYHCAPYVPSSSTTSTSRTPSTTSTDTSPSTIKTSSTSQSRTSSSTPVPPITSHKDVPTPPGSATEGTVGQTSTDSIVSSTVTIGGGNGKSPSSAASSSDSDLIIGAVAGIVGIVALIALVVACGICMRNRQKRKDASEYPRENSSRGPSLVHSSRQNNNNHVYTGSEMDMHSHNGRMSDIPQDGSGVGVRELETDVDSTPSGNPRQYEYAHNIERADNQRAGEQESEHSSEAIYSAVDKSRKSKHRNEEVELAENDMYATRIT